MIYRHLRPLQHLPWSLFLYSESTKTSPLHRLYCITAARLSHSPLGSLHLLVQLLQLTFVNLLWMLWTSSLSSLGLLCVLPTSSVLTKLHSLPCSYSPPLFLSSCLSLSVSWKLTRRATALLSIPISVSSIALCFQSSHPLLSLSLSWSISIPSSFSCLVSRPYESLSVSVSSPPLRHFLSFSLPRRQAEGLNRIPKSKLQSGEKSDLNGLDYPVARSFIAILFLILLVHSKLTRSLVLISQL